MPTNSPRIRDAAKHATHQRHSHRPRVTNPRGVTPTRLNPLPSSISVGDNDATVDLARSIRSNTSLMSSSPALATVGWISPRASKSSASAMSWRVPTMEPRMVSPLSTMSKIGAGKSPGGSPLKTMVPPRRTGPAWSRRFRWRPRGDPLRARTGRRCGRVRRCRNRHPLSGPGVGDLEVLVDGDAGAQED